MTDFRLAVDRILGGTGEAPRVLVVRLDSDGDVLLAGPAIRAVAASAAQSACCARHAAVKLPGCCPASTSPRAPRAVDRSRAPPVDPARPAALLAAVERRPSTTR